MRTFGDRHVIFHGPTWLYAPKRIQPLRVVKWDEDTGLPLYEEGAAVEQPAEGKEATAEE